MAQRREAYLISKNLLKVGRVDLTAQVIEHVWQTSYEEYVD